MAKSDQTIFISHIHEEESLALALQKWIRSSFADRFEVFVSSDKKSIPLGADSMETIKSAIQRCSIMIVLCSSHSLKRPWINFESGCAWISNKYLIPICHTDMTKENLPVPYDRQGVDLSTGFAHDLITDLARKLELTESPNIHFEKMEIEVFDAMKKCIVTISPVKDTLQGHEEIAIDAIEMMILKFIADCDLDDLPPEEEILEFLKDTKGLSHQKSKYYIEKLHYINKLIETERCDAEDEEVEEIYYDGYTLTQSGRKWLIDNELL